jgi:predicted O-linked N-acetylglucosamine transferase (SPINDLY family)
MHAAAASLQRVLEVEPDRPLVDLRAAASLCPAVFADSAELHAQRQILLQTAADFTARKIHVAPLDLLQSHAEFPFNAQFLDGNLRELRAAYAGIFQHLFTEPAPTAGTDRPRIGFVVTKGHEGVFLKSQRGVLARLDRQRFAVVVIAPVASAARIKQAVEHPDTELVPLPDRSDHALEAIRAARLDVLYHWEIGTDSHNYFLPMFRLAPVQCTSWGLQATSGMPDVAAYLSSTLVEPADAAAHYSEQLLLANTLLTYQSRLQLPENPKSREDFGLTAAQHVYTCAQHLGKFHPDFDPLLGGILRNDPQGVLVITEDRFRFAAEQLKARFASTLPDVAGRVRWLPRLPIEEYRALIAASDVLLDPPHFGGVNSTYDGLALGKPIVTCPSPFQRGRYTLGCYRKMNIDDCIATDAAAYVKIAVRLGTDSDYRAALSHRILGASEVLFEDQEAVREHERLFEILVEGARRIQK